jgi:NAD(P)-dependent dehydrogenase (short-subunit alcohol dehydrogenase family)
MTGPRKDELRGAQVLVVGTGPMGRATARRALDAGANVTLAGRSAGRLAEAAAGTSGMKTVVADTEQPDQAEELMASGAPWDHVAILAGGVGARASGITRTTLPEAQRAFARLWLTYNLLRAAPGTVRAGGSVCVLSGSSGRKPLTGFGVWGTLHGSLEALALSAAVELSPVRVNVVSPGGIGIRMDRQLIPRPGVAEDVADMVCALMGNPAVTNAVVDVDGGERLGTYPSPLNSWAALSH